MQLLASANIPSQMIAIRRQELDSMVRVTTIGIWLSINLFAAQVVLIGQWVKLGFRHAKN